MRLYILLAGQYVVLWWEGSEIFGQVLAHTLRFRMKWKGHGPTAQQSVYDRKT
jgi:hypothetical protein